MNATPKRNIAAELAQEGRIALERAQLLLDAQTHIQDQERELGALDLALHLKSEAFDSAQQENRRLQAKADKLNEEVKQKIAEGSTLTEQLTEALAQKGLLTNQCDQLKQWNETLKGEINQKELTITALNERLKDTTAQKERAEEQGKRLTQENTTLTGEREQLHSERGRLQGQLKIEQKANQRLLEMEKLVGMAVDHLRNVLWQAELLPFQPEIERAETDVKIIGWIAENFAVQVTEKQRLAAQLEETERSLAEASKQAERHVRFEQQWDNLSLEGRLAFAKAIVPTNHSYAKPLERGQSVVRTFTHILDIQKYLKEAPNSFQQARADLDCDKTTMQWMPLDMAWDVLESARRWTDRQIEGAGIRAIRPEAGSSFIRSEHQLLPEMQGIPLSDPVIARCLRSGYAFEGKVVIKADVELVSAAALPALQQQNKRAETETLSATDATESPDMAAGEPPSAAPEAMPHARTSPSNAPEEHATTLPTDRASADSAVLASVDPPESVPQDAEPEWYRPLYEAALGKTDPYTSQQLDAIKALIQWAKQPRSHRFGTNEAAAPLETLIPVFTPGHQEGKQLNLDWLRVFETERPRIVGWLTQQGIQVVSPKFGTPYNEATMEADVVRRPVLGIGKKPAVDRVQSVGFLQGEEGSEKVLCKARVILR